MTIPRLKEITEYQRSNPPVHIMIAAYFGVGGKPEEKEEPGGLADLLANIPMVHHETPT